MSTFRGKENHLVLAKKKKKEKNDGTTCARPTTNLRPNLRQQTNKKRKYDQYADTHIRRLTTINVRIRR